MKIRNVHHSALELHPRSEPGFQPGTGVLVEPGALIDLEPDVAGTPPTAAYFAANEEIVGMSETDPRFADLKAVLQDRSQHGSKLLAQHDLWQLADEPKAKARKADEEGAP